MREWLRNHKLFSFYALVFLISWIPGIPHWMGIEGQALEMAFWLVQMDVFCEAWAGTKRPGKVSAPQGYITLFKNEEK